MKIPNDPADQQTFIRYIIDICMDSREERREMYEKRRRYYNYGQNVEEKCKHNRLKAHIELVSSFLFSPDGLHYSMAAQSAADDGEIARVTALQDSWNQDVQDDGIADEFAQAVTWSLNFDTMIVKQGWNDITKQQFMTLIDPYDFGVLRESVTDPASQQAFVQAYVIDYDEACERLLRAGRPGDIAKLKEASPETDTGLPHAVSQLVIAATGGMNLSGNVQGQVNPNYEPVPTYRAREMAPCCPFYNVWVWDSDQNDYREFEVIEPDIIISDSLKTIDAIKKAQGPKGRDYASNSNFFLPKENPFTLVTPFKMLKYIWGDSHIEDLIPLQCWSNQRLDQINELLEKQYDPAKVFSGFMGLDDEKFGALGGPGSWVADAAPGAKVDELKPQMPEDLFKEYDQIGNLMLEASGLTETVAGKGTGGARGGKQAKQMQITGGGRIRRVALGLEKPLVRIGDIGVKLKMKNDDDEIKSPTGEEFVASQLNQVNYTMRVAGHSHSPLFTMETEELATLLLKARALDQEGFVRMLNPPMQGAILHSLHKRQAAEAEAAKQKAMQGQQPAKPGPKKEREGEG
jgi:hypothetical protein